jgi:hypothetical protein
MMAARDGKNSGGGSGRAALVTTCGVLWVAAVFGPPAAFLRWREQRLPMVARPAVQADWDAFRTDMQRQTGRDGPVQRKVPKSPEPPELVWLRDYPGLAITAWIVLVGVLGGFLGLAAMGVGLSGDRRGDGGLKGTRT